jgi:hypothetical protein
MSDIERMAEDLASTINSHAGSTDDHVYATDLIRLIRAVIRDELDKQKPVVERGPTLLTTLVMGAGDCQGWCCGGNEDANPNH